MSQIFVSHSRRDEDLDFFHKAFSTSGIKSVFMEYEDIGKPAWRSIKENVKAADSVFVLLSREMKDLEHTQNWISFEVGLACQARKRVWVFEKIHEDINFAVPYLTHYILYDPNKPEHFKEIRWIIQKKGKPIKFGIPLVCDYCGVNYSLGTRIRGWWKCPCCGGLGRWSVPPWESGENVKRGMRNWRYLSEVQTRYE